MRAYLHLHGPATLAEAAAFLGAHSRDLDTFLPADVAHVGVVDAEGRSRPALALAADLEPLSDPPDPPPLRLLPPSDPFLQARDRDLVVPDAGQRERLFPVLGRPGAVLVHGEVAGTWRARKAGRRLEMELQLFGRQPPGARQHLDPEAELIATARNASSVTVAVQ